MSDTPVTAETVNNLATVKACIYRVLEAPDDRRRVAAGFDLGAAFGELSDDVKFLVGFVEAATEHQALMLTRLGGLMVTMAETSSEAERLDAAASAQAIIGALRDNLPAFTAEDLEAADAAA